jgi:hypothetical protein
MNGIGGGFTIIYMDLSSKYMGGNSAEIKGARGSING